MVNDFDGFLYSQTGRRACGDADSGNMTGLRSLAASHIAAVADTVQRSALLPRTQRAGVAGAVCAAGSNKNIPVKPTDPGIDVRLVEQLANIRKIQSGLLVVHATDH